jgi:hypothetical protein
MFVIPAVFYLSIRLVVRVLACMSIITAVFYLSIRLVGCSINSRISYGARNLNRTPQVKIKKDNIFLKQSDRDYQAPSIL